MLSLRDAIRVVEERQSAVMGEAFDAPPGTLFFSNDDNADRAIISGYDVDYDELLEIVEDMAVLYSNVAYHNGLGVAFRAAISNAIQIGLVKGADSRA